MGLVIAGIDPGGTTGYCLIHEPMQLMSCGEGNDRAKVLAWVMANKPNKIIVEDFKLYPSMGVKLGWMNMPATKVIGALEDLCEREGIELIKQSPSLKERITDKILRTAKLYQTTHPHANDAIRHALYYLWFKKGLATSEEVSQILLKASRRDDGSKYKRDGEYLKELRKLAVMSAMFYNDTKQIKDIPIEKLVYISLSPGQTVYHLYKDCSGMSEKYMPVLTDWLDGKWHLCTECKVRQEYSNMLDNIKE